MSLSIRAYARQRGVSDAAVRKAIKAGRISALPDGTIDPELADRQWAAGSDPAKQRGEESSSGGSFIQARTANEVVKAQMGRLKLQKLKNELIERDKAIAHVFRLARQERDAWQSWPSRVAALMAAELEVETHQMQNLLETYVRDHLNQLGDLRIGNWE